MESAEETGNLEELQSLIRRAIARGSLLETRLRRAGLIHQADAEREHLSQLRRLARELGVGTALEV